MKRKLPEKQRGLLMLIAAIVITMVLLFPLYWMLTTAVRTPGEAFSNPTFFPQEISLDAFRFTAENGITLDVFFLNSVIVSLGATLLTVLLAVPASYGLARFRNWWVGFLLFIFLVAQMMPSSLILTPLFIAFSKLGLINNLLGVILADATVTIPFAIIILRTFFKDIPKELEEAATIDGCGPFATFLHIMVPVSYPGIVTATAMSLFMAWGDMVFSLTFLNKDALKTLPLILYKAMGELGVRWEVLMAYATMVVAPIVIVFILLQRHIVSGLTAGAVKG
ncbi:MAG: carbohydrate ABC transporter permease [Eubacteriales bacterium]|nr:carbohydrate ABC transporter permease [Eubacteriales bacterium]